jgi:hypothetical protein
MSNEMWMRHSTNNDSFMMIAEEIPVIKRAIKIIHHMAALPRAATAMAMAAPVSEEW